ncbi:MAG: hypothetical protein ACLFTV_04535 [Desulfococcaceae bacterium]
MHRILTVAAGLFAILALAACGTRPDIASTEKKPGETYSADEVRYRTVDQPFMISGDYFREREQEPSIALDLSGDRSKDSAKKEGMEETGGAAETASAAESEADVRQAERAAPAAARSQSPAAASPQPAPVPPAPLAFEETAPPPPAPVKIALIVDEENIAPEISAALPAALIRAAEELPVVVAAPDRVTEVILGPTCPGRRDLGCLSSALSVYPGARMVLLAERVEMPGRYPGNVQAQVAVVDAGLSYRYPAMAVTAPAREAADARTAMAAMMHKVLTFCVDRADMLPWFCRAFSREGEEWYLSAGARSGLKPGDRLRVIPGGRVVRSPAGTPAGWIPEAPVGAVEVTLLFGPDFAAARLLEGRGPEPGDMVMRP